METQARKIAVDSYDFAHMKWTNEIVGSHTQTHFWMTCVWLFNHLDDTLYTASGQSMRFSFFEKYWTRLYDTIFTNTHQQ